jgi:hypothetical protein
MNFIISEQQQERLSTYDKVQKMFFRYWYKNGPKVDDLFFKLFGFTNIGLEYGGFMISKNDVYRMLRKWYGGDEAKYKAIELLNKKNYTINSCGGYNFDFDVVDYEIDDDIGEIFIDVKPDVKNGKVILLMIGGEEQNLGDALNNDDYGWEIEGEIADCAYELLHDKITNTTGYEIGINKLILD